MTIIPKFTNKAKLISEVPPFFKTCGISIIANEYYRVSVLYKFGLHRAILKTLKIVLTATIAGT